MFEAYLKHPIAGEEGAFNNIRLEAEDVESLQAKIGTFVSAGYFGSTIEEYTAQFADRTALVESADDAALGVVAEAPAAPAAPEATEAAPEVAVVEDAPEAPVAEVVADEAVEVAEAQPEIPAES